MTTATTADLEALRAEFIAMNSAMANRISSIVEEMQTVPARVQGEVESKAQNLRSEFGSIVDSRAQVIERLVNMMNPDSMNRTGKKPFKPETLLPNVWTGDKDPVTWSEFVTDIRNWMQAEYQQDGVDILDIAEMMSQWDSSEFDGYNRELLNNINSALYSVLISRTRGAPKSIVRQQKAGQGLRTWYMLQAKYDSNQTTDRGTAMRDIQNPGKKGIQCKRPRR